MHGYIGFLKRAFNSTCLVCSECHTTLNQQSGIKRFVTSQTVAGESGETERQRDGGTEGWSDGVRV
jgi:hypothetical protein